MSDFSRPEHRVLAEGRTDLASYMHVIASSTSARHSPAIEAMIERAAARYRRLHQVYVDYLAAGGQPGRETKSPRWREASSNWIAVQEMLAAGFAELYPKSDRPLPLAEVHELVRTRVGPLCTGWISEDGTLSHHRYQTCDVHPEAPNL